MRARWLASAIGVAMAFSPQAATLAQPAAAAQPAPAAPGATPPPNVLLILVDDLGARDLGSYGSVAYSTPNLDRFGARAMIMQQGYSPSPVCSPSRAGLLTGKNPARLGITNWLPGDYPPGRRLVEPPQRTGLALDETTLAERFKAAGYRTFLSGKWHLGDGPLNPIAQGFEINAGGGHEGEPGSYYAPYRLSGLRDGPKGEFLTDRQANDTIAFLEQDGQRPFFAMLSFYTVHTPLTPPPDGTAADEARIAALPKPAVPFVREGSAWTKQAQDNAVYAAMVRSMDSAVGRVLDTLGRLKLDDNTIVIFVSDNGGLSTRTPRRDGMPYTQIATSNAPLRAGKGWLFEGGTRIPFMVHVPGCRAGQTAVPVTLLDVTPTLVSLAKLAPLRAGEGDGDDLTPLLCGRGNATLGKRPLYWYFPHYHVSGVVPASSVMVDGWKLVHSYETGKDSLYNLSTDPDETTDLADRQKARASALRRQLDTWLANTKAGLPQLRDPASKGAAQ